MSNWESINFSNFLPPEVPAAILQVTSLIDQFLTLYKQGITVAKGYALMLDAGGPDLLGVLIQALIDLVEGMMQAGKVHVLFVPIPKLYPQSSNTVIAPTLEAMALELGFNFQEAAAVFRTGANTAYTSLVGQRGGNAAFFRTFVQSLNDIYDLNRPQYMRPNDAVTMTVMMVGAPSFSGLVEAAAAFNRLFRPQMNSDLTSRMIPVPGGLRATVIGLPQAQRIGVRLVWQAAPPTFSSPYFPGVYTKVKKYAVIRCTDPTIATNARSVLDFFSTQDLTVGMTSDDPDKVSKVIAIGTGSNSSYIDDDETLDRDHTYHYCVAWQIDVEENGSIVPLKYDRVSNVVKTRVRVAPPGQSTPPDWIAYGSMIDIVPELAVTLRIMLEQIKTLAGRQGGGAKGSLSVALTLIEKNLNEFVRRLGDLNARVKRLAAIAATPLPGLYTTSITGVGGNAFLTGELAARLQDKSDPGRPPYDDNEYVMGVCLVAGGPRIPDIQPIIDFLGSLFAPPAAKDPLYNVLSAVDTAVEAEERYTFGPNMQSYPPNADGTVQVPAGTLLPVGAVLPDGTTGGAVQPDGTVLPIGTVAVVPDGGAALDPAAIDPSTGLPAVDTKPVIADDGTPVDADDPKSPYTGDP